MVFIPINYYLALGAVIPPRFFPASGHLCLTEEVAGGHLVADSVAYESGFSSCFLDDFRLGRAVVPRGSSVTPEVALPSTSARLSTWLIVPFEGKIFVLFPLDETVRIKITAYQ